MIYFPTRQELKNAIERAITEGITIVCNNQQFLVNPEFAEYTSSRDDFEDKSIDE
jgi:hypothetical protein